MATGEMALDSETEADTLRRLERMLTQKPAAGQPGRLEQPPLSYGDLTALNTSRLILDSVPPSLLSDIVSDFLDLLGTSCAVYEKNGDYALGISSSSWCRFMDLSSRSLCGTPDNREALASGKWHCHESCWNDASLRSIETGEPVDVECRGGIRLFAAPIRAGNEIVGSINLGYGDPPRDPARLRELADAYCVSVDELRERAEACETRPLFIIELAKKRLLSAARLIGALIERRRAEEALREAHEQNRATLRALPDHYFEVDRDGRIHDYHTRHPEMLFVPPSKFLGRTVSELLPEEAARIINNAISRAVEQGHHHGAVYPLQLRGGLSYFELSIAAKGNPHLPEARLVALARDVTERERMHRALREEFAFRNGIIECAAEGLCVCHETADFPYVGFTVWNGRMTEITGYTLEEINRLGWYQTLYPDPDVQARARDRMARMRQGDDLKGEEWEIVRSDGTKRVVSISTSIVRKGASEVHVLALMQDLTEQKRAAEERSRLEAQMQEVQRLESLGVLAGGIAHDFNNLLMAILGNADLALHILSPASPARRNVEGIEKASRRAADLCRQMLAYSGKGRFVVGRCDLSEIVREMAQMLEISISKKAALRYSFAQNLPMVEADATQLRQIVMNLITNASEACGDESSVISISTGVTECDRAFLSETYPDDQLPEGRYVYLEVSDTGSGMDAETQCRIFDPFFTTKFTGRGLGLAAVLGIVRGHKGAVKVYSDPGKGTTFKIVLPALEWTPADRAQIAEESAPLRGGGTILLVDDEPCARSVGSEMLARLGFRVLTAVDGRAGLELFRTRGSEIDCVILDLTMPEMGGEEVFREMRRLRCDVRVILSSGFGEQEVTRRFVDKGLAGFVQKPYTVAGLQETLKSVLG